MLLNLKEIEHFSMTYIFIEGEEDIVCEYEQIDKLVIATDGNSVSFTLKNLDETQDSDEYVTTLIQEGDELFLKSTYFEDTEELYPLSVEIFEKDITFTLAGEDEVMYLYGFLA